MGIALKKQGKLEEAIEKYKKLFHLSLIMRMLITT